MNINNIIDGIITRLNAHASRHQKSGADEMSLAGLTVASESIDFTLVEVTTATTLTADHFLVVVNAPGSTKMTLPAATSHTNRIYTIKNIHSTGTVTIDANGSEKIDGEETIDLNLQYAYLIIVCDGSEWFIIGGEYVKMEEILRAQETLMERLAKQLKAILRCLSSMSGLNIDEED